MFSVIFADLILCERLFGHHIIKKNNLHIKNIIEMYIYTVIKIEIYLNILHSNYIYLYI